MASKKRDETKARFRIMARNDEREAQARKHVAIMKVVFERETREAIGTTRIIEAGYAPEPGILLEDAFPPRAAGPAGDADLPGEAAVPAAAAPEEAVPEAEPVPPAPDGPGDAPAAPAGRTEIAFARGGIATAVLKAPKPVAVLDAASYRYAGGGYLRGWSGPEEDLCAESNLYPILEAHQRGFYAENRQTASGELYTSRALAIPDVMFTRHGEIAPCSVCVMAAPNRARALERNRSERECDLALAERVDAAMRILASFGARTVVLPAFGCGQSGNDAAEVARLFREWIEAHEGLIPRIEFAVWRGPDADAFEAAFADRTHRADEPCAAEIPAGDEGEDGEEDDWERYRISG